MTTATDHKNNLNSSALKKNYARTLRVETIANSAGGTTEVAIVAQPSTGFLNTRFYPDGSPTEDTEDCLGRITVGLTRSKSLTLLVSPLDMMGLMGMAQVIATIAYGIQGLRRGKPPGIGLISMPIQMRRWSLNTIPSWSECTNSRHTLKTCLCCAFYWRKPCHGHTSISPLAIANKYHDHQTNQPKSARHRLILVRVSDLDWLKGDRLKDLQAHVTAGHKWIPVQQLPFAEIILYAYAADRTNRPTYVCLPSGLYNARTGRVLAQAGPEQEITPVPGIYFFDGWRVHPTLVIPPTYQAPKKHQYVMLKPPHTALQTQNNPGRRRKRRVTSLLPLRRTKPKTDPALAGQPSVHVST